MRVVIDTSTVVSGIFWTGPPHRVLECWMREAITLLVSQAILTEYERVIARLAGRLGSPHLASRWMGLLARHAHLIEAPNAGVACRDADDVKFLDCAIAGRAEAVVTSDADLLVLKTVHDIPILSPSAFMQRYAAR